jgi:putative redox protein
MEVTIEYLGAVQFEVRARNHTIICDQPEENGGFDEGITPPELMLASLGTCAGYYAAEYLNTRRLPTSGMRIRVTAGKAKSPARLSSFKVEVRLPAAIDSHRREGVVRAIHSCLIHNTLLNPPKIELDVMAPADPELPGEPSSELTQPSAK